MTPIFVGMTLVVMFLAFLVGLAVADARLGAVAAGVVALLFLGVYLERPQTIEAWRIGAEGERRTGRHLEGLVKAGFITLHDRKVPGYGGNLDHIVIGPTGVWAVETKNLAGKVVIDGDSGFVVPPSDARALADAVERVLRDPALARRLAERGERRVRDHFSLEAMLRSFDELYRSQLERAGIQIGAPIADGVVRDRASHA